MCGPSSPNLAFCILTLMHASPPVTLCKSRMRKSACTDLCGGAISDGSPYRDSNGANRVCWNYFRIARGPGTTPSGTQTGRSCRVTRLYLRLELDDNTHGKSRGFG